MKTKKVKKEKVAGITLIALVITIVVLLILAGITIITLTGENGILTRASTVKEEQRAAEVLEQKDLWRNSLVIDEYIGSSEAESLNELLARLRGEKLLTDEEVEFIKIEGYVRIASKDIFFTNEQIEKVATLPELLANGEIKIGDYVEYSMEKANGTYTVSKDLTLSNNDQTFDSSSYASGKWQILYTGEEGYGTQIVSSDNVLGNDRNGNLTIGKSYPDEGENGATSYNNAIQVLNNISENYLNTKYAVSARALGSQPTDTQNTIGSLDTYNIQNETLSSLYKDSIKVSDIRHEKDLQQLDKEESMKNTTCDIWLASREVIEEPEKSLLELRVFCMNSKDRSFGSLIVCNYSMSWASVWKEKISKGLRPVIKLKDDVTLAKKYDENGNTVWKILSQDNNSYGKIKKVIGDTKDWKIEGNTIVEYLGNKDTYKDIVIPNYVGDTRITAIGSSVFSGDAVATSLTISEGINTIGQGAFSGCTGLKGDLVIPDSTTSVGQAAFYGCSGFNGKLKLGNNLITIGMGAFCNCIGLTGDLVIPDSTISIEREGFSGCKALDGNLKLGNNLKTIGLWAFSGCSNLKGDLIIPDSTTYIGPMAFQRCSGFDGKLKLGNNLTTIESGAFYACKNLKGDLIIPDSITKLVSGAFCDCNGFTGDLVVGNGITTIDKSTFAGLTNLRGDLIIGKNVTTIESGAFENIGTNKKNLVIKMKNIPDGFTSNYLSKITFSGNLTISNDVETIGNGSFSNLECSGKLVIGNKVKSIGTWAFSDCSGLTGDLVIPDSTISIGMAAFSGCVALDGQLKLGKNLNKIGAIAFRECSKLTGDLIIPDSITTIESSAFLGCSGLNGNLVIGKNVIEIQSSAFNGPKISTLIFPSDSESKLVTIGREAFYNCGASEAHIPNTVTTIGNNAFYAVGHIYYNGTATGSPWGASAIN